jgi:competence protein ComEA
MRNHFKLLPVIITAMTLLTGCDAGAPTPDSASDKRAAKPLAEKPPAEGSLRMNINTATLTELETIPGVGESLAKLIVAGRPYTSVDELEKVSGIGPKSLKDLRPYVKVEGELEKLR